MEQPAALWGLRLSWMSPTAARARSGEGCSSLQFADVVLFTVGFVDSFFFKGVSFWNWLTKSVALVWKWQVKKKVQSGDRYKAAWKDSIPRAEFESNSLGIALPVAVAICRTLRVQHYRWLSAARCTQSYTARGTPITSAASLIIKAEACLFGFLSSPKRTSQPRGAGERRSGRWGEMFPRAPRLRAPAQPERSASCPAPGANPSALRRGVSARLRSRNTAKCVLHRSRASSLKRWEMSPRSLFW